MPFDPEENFDEYADWDEIEEDDEDEEDVIGEGDFTLSIQELEHIHKALNALFDEE